MTDESLPKTALAWIPQERPEGIWRHMAEKILVNNVGDKQEDSKGAGKVEITKRTIDR